MEYKGYTNNIDESLKSEIKNRLTSFNLDWYATDDEITKIKELSNVIKDKADVFLVIGIGGSYMGSKAVIEALKPYFYNQTSKPQIYYVGTNLSDEYIKDLTNLISEKSIYVNVISKSGNTLETKLTYQLIYNLMSKKYNEEELKSRFIITTGSSGYLRDEVNNKGYNSLIVPDVSGRYSLLTNVGLLAMAVMDINIDELIRGVKTDTYNDSVIYAINRQQLFSNNKIVEGYAIYEPKLYYMLEWLKQLYAESLGKNKKGILPISLVYTQDLHSMEQFTVDGNPVMFETFIKTPSNMINNLVYDSILETRNKLNLPYNVVDMGEISEYNLGVLLNFFMTACVISAILNNVNPFDQPGVEEYKSVINNKLKKD